MNAPKLQECFMSTTIAPVPYHIVPIHSAFLQRLRDLGLDDQAQLGEHHVATGGEPCRDVLRRAQPGERIMLASYTPFTRPGPYKEFGPIFVMADSAEPAAPLPQTLDALSAIGYLRDTFVLRAYDAQDRIVDGVVVPSATAEHTLQDMLGRDGVRYVLVRFAGYGCYACRIEASSAEPAVSH